MSIPKFAETHNVVAFLEKPEESNGFEGIIDFLNASSIKYALTVNPTVYESCIKQFWETAKAKIVNGEHQIQALVDRKKVIITEKSVRSDLMLEDDERTECLPNDVIFEQLTLMGSKITACNEFSSTMASAIIFFLDNQVEGMTKHKGIYVTPSHTKKVFANMKREGKGFSGKVTPLFQTMMVQALEDMDPIPDEATNEEHVSTPSYDPSQSGEDRLPLTELMTLCISLQEKVLDLEKAKTAQAKEIACLKKRGRKIVDLDADKEVTLIDETQERNDEEMLFDVQDDLRGEEVVAEKEVAEKEVSVADLITTAGEVVTTTNINELTLAQTLIEIKTPKPKAITTAATTTTTTRPKARGVVVQEPNQIALDEEVARNLKAQLQAELEEERLARQKKEEATIALIES
ncbi:hypothetical protein Tco_0002943 [Tanacetum coccineum]